MQSAQLSIILNEIYKFKYIDWSNQSLNVPKVCLFIIFAMVLMSLNIK